MWNDNDDVDDDDLVPPGFRFYPREEELVSFYLRHMLQGSGPPGLNRVIPLLDIYDHNPWDLPKYGGEWSYGGDDSEEWFFFVPRQEREARGGRPNRLTAEGYWKATGSPLDVYTSYNYINKVDHHHRGVIGRKRTMVFYIGRAPCGRKTLWKMNEYKAFLAPPATSDHHQASSSSISSIAPIPQLREELSLCRIYKSSKCLRAYDRRPLPPEAARDVIQAADHHEEATLSFINTDDQHINPMVKEMAGYCSSSRDQTTTNTSTTNSKSLESRNHSEFNNYHCSEYEPLWDSEQFNWNRY